MTVGLQCYICWQPGHYATQCPQKDKEKELALNTITTEVQQVIIRSKVMVSEWEVQEEIRKAAKVWIEKANKVNTIQMQQDMRSNLIVEAIP